MNVIEGKQELTLDFRRVIGPALVSFLRSALEAMFVRGFMPWYVGDVEGAHIPIVLLLAAETSSRILPAANVPTRAGGQ